MTDYEVCRAKAFIIEDDFMDQRPWTEWFYTDEEDRAILRTMKITAVLLIGGLAVFLILCTIVVIILNRRHTKEPKLVIEKTNLALPAHMVFQNLRSLSSMLKSAAEHPPDITEEFEKLDKFAKTEIESKETCKEGEKNTRRNRYNDIVPYDKNLLLLSRPTGNFVCICSGVIISCVF